MEVLASYAVGVALNNYVPANMGTFVMLLMYVAVVRGDSVEVRGSQLRRGDRVRLRPKAGGDILDLAMTGRTAAGLDELSGEGLATLRSRMPPIAQV